MSGAWGPAAAPPALPPRAVHVWRIDLDAAVPAGLALAPSLPDDERRRAERFRFPRDRERFLAGRAALRGILGGYLDRPPQDIALGRGPSGKPLLLGPVGGLEFNLAHAEGCALLALTRGRRVGVDVEGLRLGESGMDVARRFFAPAEVARLRATAEDARPLTFVRCWTRKEAYVKARGDGLSLPLQQFQVPLAPDATRALLASSDGPEEVARWTLRELPVARRYLGALVVEGPIGALTLLDWIAPGTPGEIPRLDSAAPTGYPGRTSMSLHPRQPAP